MGCQRVTEIYSQLNKITGFRGCVKLPWTAVTLIDFSDQRTNRTAGIKFYNNITTLVLEQQNFTRYSLYSSLNVRVCVAHENCG